MYEGLLKKIWNTVVSKNELKVESNQADKRFSLKSFKGGSSQEKQLKCMIALWHENNLNGI